MEAPAGSPPLAARLLGAACVSLDGRRIDGDLYQPARHLLLLLCATPQQGVSRDEAAGLLWPENEPPKARRNLRQALLTVRKALGDADQALEAGRDRIVLHVPASFSDLGQLVRLATNWSDPGPLREPSRADVDHALRLADGTFLQDITSASAAFGAWVARWRERVARWQAGALAGMGERLAALGRWKELAEIGNALVAMDACDERGHRFLMRAYAGQGAEPSALRQYEMCAEILARELDHTPSPETEDLRVEIIRGRDHTAPGSAAAGSAPQSGSVAVLAVMPAPGQGAADAEIMERRQALEGLARHVAERHGASIHRELGSGLLLLFGWPVALQDPLESALHAAQHLLGALPVRAGVATAPLIADTSGGTPLPFTLAADRASLLRSHAPALGLALDGPVARILGLTQGDGGAGDSAFLPPDRLAEAIRRAYRQSTSPATGIRETERAMLDAAWLEGLEGRRRVVVVRGSPGMETGRLLRDWVGAGDGLVAAGARRIIWRCSDAAVRHPFAPILAWLNDWLAEPAEDGFSAALQPAARALRERLEGLVGPERFPTPDERQQAQALTLRLLATLAEGKPLLLALEDAEWADHDTWSVVLEAVTASNIPHLLAAIACDSAASLPGLPRSGRKEITLGPLDRQDQMRLLRHWLPGIDLDTRLSRRIDRLAQGNPLALRNLAEAVREHGEAALDRPEAAASLTGVFAARLARLGDGRLLAPMVAVLGSHATRDELAALSGWARERLEAALAELRGADLLQGSGGNAGPWRFAHALARRAALESLPAAERAALHARALRLLRQLGRADALRAAPLAEGAGDREQAFDQWRRAARMLVRQGNLSEARECAERAAALLPEIPAPPPAERAELLVILGELRTRFDGAGHPAVGEAFAEAADTNGASEEVRARVLAGLFGHHITREEPQALAYRDALAAEAARPGASSLTQLLESAASGRWAFWTGEVGRALSVLEKARALADAVAPAPLPVQTEARIGIQAHLATAYTASGRLRQGKAALDRLVLMVDGLREPQAMAEAYALEMLVHHLRQDPVRLAATVAKAARLIDAYGVATFGGLAAVVRVSVNLSGGEPQTLIAYANELLAQPAANLNISLVAIMARTCVEAGADDLALALLDRADAAARERGAPHFWDQPLKITRAQLLARRGQIAPARDLFDAAWRQLMADGNVILALRAARARMMLDAATGGEEGLRQLRHTLKRLEPDPSAPAWNEAAAALRDEPRLQ